MAEKDLIKQEKRISHEKSEGLGIVLTKLLKNSAEKERETLYIKNNPTV